MTEPSAVPAVVGEHPPLDPQCHPCRTARIYHHWADSIPWGYTHCKGCHLTWKINNTTGHCAACHETFRGVGAFDSHQQTHSAGVLCLTAKEIAESTISHTSGGKTVSRAAFLKDENGFWYLNRPFGGGKG